MVKPDVAKPISDKVKGMINNALAALENELDNLGLDDEALQVYNVRRFIKRAGEEGLLKYAVEVEE